MEENEIKNLLFKECNLNKKEDLFTQKLKSGNNFTIIKTYQMYRKDSLL